MVKIEFWLLKSKTGGQMQVIQKIKQFLLHRSLISGSSDPGSGNRLRCSRNTYIKNQRNIRIIGSVSLVLLLALTAFTIRPVSVSTDFAEATANPATTTLTVATSGDAAILDITPSSTTGTFSSSDNSGTSLAFNVSTNNITGYNLGISHASATTPAPLTSEDLSENLDSLPAGTSITESQFNSTEYVGHYGYKPSKLNSVSNSNYIPAPTTTPTTINVTQCANNTTNCNTANDEYTIALGANIDYTKSAGTYTNTFILTAVANDVPYTINYLDNTGTGGTTGTDVSNLPSSEASSTATATNFTLSSTQPTRTGYDFAGWCYGTVIHNATGNDTCSSSAASDSSAAGDGQTYSAGSTFSFAGYSTSTNVANLYAMWNVKTFAITLDKTNANAIVIDDTSYTGSSATLTYGNHTISGTYPSGYEFSSWTTSDSTNLAITSTSSASTTITVHGAATLTLNGKTSLIGYCDNNSISDANCMQRMTPSTCTTTAKTVYDDRDGSAYMVQKLADGKCWLLDNLRLGSADFASGVSYLDSTNTNTTNSIATSTFNGWKATSGFTTFTVPLINVASADTTITSYGSGSGKIGVYYNYCAATMQSYCYASGSGTGDASEDVCPKGWRMPTGGSNGEYQALYTAYSSNATNFRNALSTPLSGFSNYSSADSQGSNGMFWSSTYFNDSVMYYLYVDSSYVLQSNYNRNYGFSVRCVLKEPIQSVTYMQDVTSEMVANTTVGATATLIDKRDNQSYLVGKLADGKLWMLDNLRLGYAGFASGVNYLDSTNTNTTKSIATSTFNGWKATSGFTVYDSPKINVASANNTATTSYGSGSGKIGVYYNYCAASAGTYCMASNSGSGNASYDVCPAGWRMPTGGSSGEYQALYTAYSSNVTNFRNALSTPLSGYFYDSSAPAQGSSGYFWSSTYYDGSSMYYLNVGSSYVYPQNYNARYFGFSVRCVLKEPIESATYMQDVTSEMVANTSEGATATLRDARDNQDYTVVKINGNLWMTRNLAIGCNGSGSTYGSSMSSKSLTNIDSNVTNTSSKPWKTPTTRLTSGNSYDDPRMACSSDYGAWYNYAAASAGTITGSSNDTDATKDICPAGWRLPTNSEFSGITSQATAFSPVMGGYYYSGSISSNVRGQWWSATAYNTTYRNYLSWNPPSLKTGILDRYSGFYVRCVRSS